MDHAVNVILFFIRQNHNKLRNLLVPLDLNAPYVPASPTEVVFNLIELPDSHRQFDGRSILLGPKKFAKK